MNMDQGTVPTHDRAARALFSERQWLLDVFYHLDRTGVSLQSGQILELIPFTLEGRPECEAMLKRMFPAGLTQFGIDIIHLPPNDLVSKREIAVERVRCANYSDRQSRFISVFGCKQIEDMEGLRQLLFNPLHQGPRGRIWKVEGAATFHSDMMWFKEYCGNDIAAAHAYWSQKASEKPLVEYLLKTPVTVLDEILGA